MEPLQWNPDSIKILVALLYSVSGFSIYYFLSQAEGPVLMIRNRYPTLDQLVYSVILQRIWGFLFLGIVPLMIIVFSYRESLSFYGLSFRFLHAPPGWTYGLVPLILLLSYFTSHAPVNLERYPQIRCKNWTRGILLISAISWIIFLVGYEYFFRGFLLYSCLSVMDPWMAMVLNAALYAMAHLYKGPMETFGAIPLGFILCYVTIVTGNIWSAVLLHSLMALSNEWFSLKAHPHMQLVRR
ncbi:MAG: CPBP family intramembrane glutamic endopeptidase [Bacteroidales bacterium]